MATNECEKYVSLAEGARRLNVSLSAMRGYVRRHPLRAYRIHGGEFGVGREVALAHMVNQLLRIHKPLYGSKSLTHRHDG